MKRILMVAMLVVSLTCGWVSLSTAGEVGYTIKSSAEQGFAIKAPPKPTSASIAADALVGRPVGFGVTVAGTALFVATMPFYLGTGSTRDAAWGLIGAPGGWTFVRPIGRSDDRFEDPGIFPK